MTLGQDVSEYLDTFGLLNHIFSSFVRKKLKKNRRKKCLDAQTPQRMRRFPCLQDSWLTLPCHLAYTGLCGGLEHLKIESRLINDWFESEMGECVI